MKSLKIFLPTIALLLLATSPIHTQGLNNLTPEVLDYADVSIFSTDTMEIDTSELFNTFTTSPLDLSYEVEVSLHSNGGSKVIAGAANVYNAVEPFHSIDLDYANLHFLKFFNNQTFALVYQNSEDILGGGTHHLRVQTVERDASAIFDDSNPSKNANIFSFVLKSAAEACSDAVYDAANGLVHVLCYLQATDSDNGVLEVVTANIATNKVTNVNFSLASTQSFKVTTVVKGFLGPNSSGASTLYVYNQGNNNIAKDSATLQANNVLA